MMPKSQKLPQIIQAKTLNYQGALPEWIFCTDSRQIEPNCWFLALDGNNLNGHDFLKQALSCGAGGLIISQPTKLPQTNLPVLIADNTLRAYQQIAQEHRRMLKPIVIAITGSNGKTSTKEILREILSQKYTVVATVGNENNEIGVPKTILQAKPQTEVLIVEMGMRGLGQIANLALIAEPDYGIITNIGTSHIGLLGSRENIAQAKAELMLNLPEAKTAFVPFSEPLLKKWTDQCKARLNIKKFGEFIQLENTGAKIGFCYRTHKFTLATVNPKIIHNACAAIDLAWQLGLTNNQIQAGLNCFRSSAGRGQIRQLLCGAYIIDETYNASPESVIALAKAVNNFAGNKNKVLVLGPIKELGEFQAELLNSLFLEIRELADYFVLIGFKPELDLGNKAVFCKDQAEAREFLLNNKTKYLTENCVLGFKASRSVKLEKLIDSLE